MKQYSRPRGKYPLNVLHKVYDDEAEAIADGIVPPYYTFDTAWNAFATNGWLKYPGGKIAQILEFKVRNNNSFIKTILNLVHFTKSGPRQAHLKDGTWQKLFSFDALPVDLNVVDSKKMDLVNKWLFEGVPLADAVKILFSRQVMAQMGLSAIDNKRHKLALNTYGHWLISGAWFTHILRTNRLIRDRYMSLVGAFNKEGIDYNFVAKTLKDDIANGSDKRHINALNIAVDVLKDSEKRRDGRVDAQFSIEDEVSHSKTIEEFKTVKLLEENHSGSEAVSTEQIPSGEVAEGTDLARATPERDTPVSAIAQDPAGPAIVESKLSPAQESKMTQEQLEKALAEVLGEDYVKERDGSARKTNAA